jgi:hypothetical protein
MAGSMQQRPDVDVSEDADDDERWVQLAQQESAAAEQDSDGE